MAQHVGPEFKIQYCKKKTQRTRTYEFPNICTFAGYCTSSSYALGIIHIEIYSLSIIETWRMILCFCFIFETGVTMEPRLASDS
jgi:hypothetical protein